MNAKTTGTITGMPGLTREEIKARNLENYGSKIKKYRTEAGLSAEQLAELLQISVSSVRNWECGLTRPDPEYLCRMFTLLKVEPNVFFGIGGIGTLLTKEERRLVDQYRLLDERGRETLVALAETLRETDHRRALKAILDRVRVLPDNDRYVAAGAGEEWPDRSRTIPVVLYSSHLVERADEIMTVSGESMEPQFHDRDQILVEYCTQLHQGDIGIFYVDGRGGLIKQVAEDHLHTLNPAYQDIYTGEEGARVIGRVIGKITREMVPTPEDKALYQEAVEAYGEAL